MKQRTTIAIAALLILALALAGCVQPEEPMEAKQYTVKEKFEATMRCWDGSSSGYYILADDGTTIIIATTCVYGWTVKPGMTFYWIWTDAEPGDELNVIYDEHGDPAHITLVSKHFHLEYKGNKT